MTPVSTSSTSSYRQRYLPSPIKVLSDPRSKPEAIATLCEEAFRNGSQDTLNAIIQTIVAVSGKLTFSDQVKELLQDRGIELQQYQDGTVQLKRQLFFVRVDERHDAIDSILSTVLPEALINLTSSYDRLIEISERNAEVINELFSGSDVSLKGQLIRDAVLQGKEVELNSMIGEYVKAHGIVDLSYVNLSGVDLRQIDLENANLNYSDLSNTNLSSRFGEKRVVPDKEDRVVLKFLKGAKLVNANLFNADLQSADLSDADLTCAEMPGTLLHKANLTNANLTCVNLHGSHLHATNFSGANLMGINLSKTRMSDVNLSGASLTRARLNEVRMDRVNLTGATLRYALLDASQMTRTNFTGAAFKDASLFKADLRNQDLSGVILTGASLHSAKLGNTRLINADLTDADLEYTDLSTADLTGAILKGAKMPEKPESSGNKLVIQDPFAD